MVSYADENITKVDCGRGAVEAKNVNEIQNQKKGLIIDELSTKQTHKAELKNGNHKTKMPDEKREKEREREKGLRILNMSLCDDAEKSSFVFFHLQQ